MVAMIRICAVVIVLSPLSYMSVSRGLWAFPDYIIPAHYNTQKTRIKYRTEYRISSVLRSSKILFFTLSIPFSGCTSHKTSG
jgi:hypothetical protein